MSVQDDQPPVQDDDGEEKILAAEESFFGLGDADIENIVELLHAGYDDALIERLHDLSPVEAAQLLSKIGEEDRDLLVGRYGAGLHPETFFELDTPIRDQILPRLAPLQVAAILSELESDDALDLIVDLDPDFQKEVMRNLSARTRLALAEGLSFPEDSAGRLMQREFVAIPQFWTVGKTVDYLRAASEDLPDDFYDLFVVTPTYKVLGQIPLNRLIRARRAEKIDNLKREDIHTVPATMDQEAVAQLFKAENITSAPVVDEEERLIGVIMIDDIVDVIDEEAQEDLLKISGVEEDDLYRAVLATSTARSRWLFVNLFTAIAAACVISLFEGTIEKLVALAVLMPIVASMGGNAGMQALAVAVRALATRELSKVNERRVVVKEILVGAINGVVFATIIGGVAALWFNNDTLGLVIGAAMVINMIVAGLFGAGIPIILHKIGADPAVSSSVFLTTMTDVVGFLAFLGLASLFLV